MSRGCVLIALFALCGDAFAGAEEKAAKLSKKAVIALMEEQDPARALDLASKALNKNPDDPNALGVAAVVFIGAASAAQGEDRAELLSTGGDLLEQLRATTPDSPWLGLASQLYVEVVGGVNMALVQPVEVSCPAEAVAAFNSAEERFARSDYSQAKPFYERAVGLCPENAHYKVMYGDAFFSLGDIPSARAQYDLALAQSPHDWQALRFRGDSFAKEGDLPRARQDAIASVAANVTYGFGWSYLEGLQRQTGGAFHYVQVEKPARITGSETEPPVIVIDQTTVWPMHYAVASLAALNRFSDANGAVDALEAERFAVRMTIQALQGVDPAALDQPQNTLWRLFAEADAVGYLDEAIFVLWLDAALVPAYLAHRDAHRDRIEAYISLYLAPAAPAP
jgi:tetratricopeptide (TPR) repeat protein